jgi:iron complex outermembrane receptor protein
LVSTVSAAAKAADIPKLTPETSVNYSLGFTWQPAPNFNVTVDGYEIKIKDRIVISGTYNTGDPAFGDINTPGTINYILASQNSQQAQFFANAVNTTNKGVDIVLDYRKRWGNNHFTALLAGNIQALTIDQIHIPAALKTTPSDSASFFDDREQYFLKASAPKAKFTLSLEYGVNKLSFGTHLTYYGDVKELGFGEVSAPANAKDQYFPYVDLDNGGGVVPEIFDFHPKVTTDIYVSLKLNKKFAWTLGVDNLFNVHPDEALVKGSTSPTSGTSSFGDSESGGPYEAVQMGFNGTRLFTKLSYTF